VADLPQYLSGFGWSTTPLVLGGWSTLLHQLIWLIYYPHPIMMLHIPKWLIYPGTYVDLAHLLPTVYNVYTNRWLIFMTEWPSYPTTSCDPRRWLIYQWEDWSTFVSGWYNSPYVVETLPKPKKVIDVIYNINQCTDVVTDFVCTMTFVISILSIDNTCWNTLPLFFSVCNTQVWTVSYHRQMIMLLHIQYMQCYK